jgi:hypothetical protein
MNIAFYKALLVGVEPSSCYFFLLLCTIHAVHVPHFNVFLSITINESLRNSEHIFVRYDILTAASKKIATFGI